MNTEQHSQTSAKKSQKKSIEIDDFQLSEESFKPMTKGLGFHHEPKKAAFKPAPVEMKQSIQMKSTSLPSTQGQRQSSFIPTGTLSKDNQKTTTNHIPSGLEAFYSNTVSKQTIANVESSFFEEKPKTQTKQIKKLESASMFSQLGAYLVDIALICSFVVLTAALLIVASGIEFQIYTRIVSKQDLVVFSVAMFSIYYLLYFTILDASATPGKTIFGLRIVKTNGKTVAVKDSFFRAVISLVSAVALFLPLMLDFHGKLTDTKVVK